MRRLPLLGLSLLLLAGCGSQQLGAEPPRPEGVVRDGDTVTAAGRVVQVPGSRVRLCASEVVDAVGYAPGREPAPRMCDQGVWLEGFDLADVQGRREKEGAVEGRASVVGVLEGDTVRVQRQAAPPSPAPYPDDALRSVPCPAPEGGWPRDPSILRGPGYAPEGDANMDAERPALEAYRTAHPGDVVEIAFRRPYDDSVLLLALAADEAARDRVEAGLRPAYGVRLCVIVSRYTRAQLQAADDDLSAVNAERRAQGVYSSGHASAVDGQLQLQIDVVRYTDALAVDVARHPAGLVAVHPWLRRA